MHSLSGMAFGITNHVHISQKFEHLLDTYRRPDGSRWIGQQLDEVTGGARTGGFANLPAANRSSFFVAIR